MDETVEQFKNRITGGTVDEVITEKEARKRGYFDLQFLLRYLEDDNEFLKYFIVDGKKVIVNLEKPYLNYKKPTDINHDRVIEASELEKVKACTIDGQDCESCSG